MVIPISLNTVKVKILKTLHMVLIVKKQIIQINVFKEINSFYFYLNLKCLLVLCKNFPSPPTIIMHSMLFQKRMFIFGKCGNL